MCATLGLLLVTTGMAARSPHFDPLDLTAGRQLWAVRYDGTNLSDSAYGLGIRPDGSAVYVTGGSVGADRNDDFATIGYSLRRGRELWTSRYDGPAGGSDFALDLAVDPFGDRTYVTGESGEEENDSFPYDYATVGYDTQTGAQAWSQSYNGPFGGSDTALAVAASSGKAFVTGYSAGPAEGTIDAATVAYDGSSGAQLWVARADQLGCDSTRGTAIAASPDGFRVFVTGMATCDPEADNYLTLAYHAATGAELWSAQYNGPARAQDYTVDIGVSPDGSLVFVTGNSVGARGFDYATIAYDSDSGSERWVARYEGPGHNDFARALDTAPDGGAVYVTGYSDGRETGDDYTTVAYEATTGSKQWASRTGSDSAGFSSDWAYGLAVNPNGSRLYVTGSIAKRARGYGYGTVALDAATGNQLWGAWYGGPDSQTDDAYGIGVTPDGRYVVVTGRSERGSPSYTDYATVAYRA